MKSSQAPVSAGIPPSANSTMLSVVICGWLLAGWAIANTLITLEPVRSPPLTSQRADDAWLANIMPAEGPDSEGSSSHKSFTGKELSLSDKLPSVMIGGLKVTTYKAQTAAAEQALLPTDLRDNSSRDELNRRFHFTPYAHDPSRGAADAPITLVAFNDLACNQCAKDVKVADTVYTSDTRLVREVEVHLPLSRYSDTNLLAFYGKVAQYGGKYWEYRQKILAQASGAADNAAPTAAAAPGAAAGADDSTRAFQALVDSGVNQAQVRDWLTREARRFYREIDADATLGKALGLDNPPHFYLNGIHLGESGLPRERVLAVAQWLKSRQAYRLDNEPMATLGTPAAAVATSATTQP